MTAISPPTEDDIRRWLEEARQEFAGIEGHPDEDAEHVRWSLKWAEDLLDIGQGLRRILDAVRKQRDEAFRADMSGLSERERDAAMIELELYP